jgi:signal transduction histidine kinase
MLGYLESLDIKRDALSDGERRAFLATALRQGKRLRDLTEKLFELSSLEAQESAPDNEPFSISELAHDAIRKHRAKADARGIETWVQSAPDLPFARGDVGLTERALDNLMDNALTHTEKGGFARLEVASEGDWIVVTVSDNGKGIPENARSRVFDPMFKLYETLEGESHAGLGLAIAKRCVELQGGDIRLETAEGQGSRFIFRLPACTPTNPDPSRRT